MKKINRVINDCEYCVHCMKFFVKVNGELHAINEKVQCCNKAMSAEEIKKRMKGEVLCEHFKLEPSTELENISYALSGIMSELYDIKKLLEKKKTNNAKTSDPTE